MTVQPWHAFCHEVLVAGFQIIQQKTFIKDGTRRTHLIAAHPNPFLLLNASSSGGRSGDEERVNDATVYAFVDIAGLDNDIRMFLLDCTHESTTHSPVACVYHLVFATMEKIVAIGNLGRFVAWPHKHIFASVACFQIDEDVHQAWRQFCAIAPDWVLNSVRP
jgi:hypothetical protein